MRSRLCRRRRSAWSSIIATGSRTFFRFAPRRRPGMFMAPRPRWVRRQQKGEEMHRLVPVMNRAIAVVGRATLVVAALILGTPAAQADGVTYPTTCNNGGVPVSGKVVLTQDIICMDIGAGNVNGLTVGAPNTTIVLNGFSIKCLDPRPSGPDHPTVNSYKFSCQGDFQISGGFFADTGIDTCGFSNVQIKGAGMIQGFSVGVRMRG